MAALPPHTYALPNIPTSALQTLQLNSALHTQHQQQVVTTPSPPKLTNSPISPAHNHNTPYSPYGFPHKSHVSRYPEVLSSKENGRFRGKGKRLFSEMSSGNHDTDHLGFRDIEVKAMHGLADKKDLEKRKKRKMVVDDGMDQKIDEESERFSQHGDEDGESYDEKFSEEEEDYDDDWGEQAEEEPVPLPVQKELLPRAKMSHQEKVEKWMEAIPADAADEDDGGEQASEENGAPNSISLWKKLPRGKISSTEKVEKWMDGISVRATRKR